MHSIFPYSFWSVCEDDGQLAKYLGQEIDWKMMVMFPGPKEDPQTHARANDDDKKDNHNSVD